MNLFQFMAGSDKHGDGQGVLGLPCHVNKLIRVSKDFVIMGDL